MLFLLRTLLRCTRPARVRIIGAAAAAAAVAFEPLLRAPIDRAREVLGRDDRAQPVERVHDDLLLGNKQASSNKQPGQIINQSIHHGVQPRTKTKEKQQKGGATTG